MTGAPSINHDSKNDSSSRRKAASIRIVGGASSQRYVPAGPDGYRMIESAEIRNFRLFEKIELSGFSRINVVVGDNAAGKTSFLEALFAATASSVEVGSRFRVWRGLESALTVAPQEIYDGLFLNLFHQFERGRVGSVSIKGSAEDTRTLQFYFDTAQPIALPLPLAEQSGVISQSYVPVAFEWTDPSGVTIKSILQMQGGNIVVVGTANRKVDSTFLPARAVLSGAENAKWFSELKKIGAETGFIKAIKEQFPEIDDVSSEADLGSYQIHVKLNWNRRRIPVALISDGMGKLMTILLHIAHSAGTVTFIDEIENGIHFSRHERMWQQIRNFSIEYQTQVFATTHSLECLRAVLPILKKHPGNFSLVRIFSKKNKGEATVISGKEALSVIASGLEVRE